MELHATTKAGARFVELGEALATRLAPTVGPADRAGTHLADHVGVLADHDWFTAPIPEELGGGGVDSVHDVLVAASRLARGDAATTIGANMHLAVVLNLVRQWRTTSAREGHTELGAGLELLAAGRVVIAAAISEPGQDLTQPSTRATPDGGGWRIDGRKIFCTMSPAADVLLASVTHSRPDGDRYGFVLIPADAPGVIIHDDWDALGMRTSGSCSITFDGVHVDRPALTAGFPVGSAAGYAARNLASGPLHAAAALGIAEGAHLEATAMLRARAHALDGSTRALVAESEVDLHAARAALALAGTVIDRHHLDHPDGFADDVTVLETFTEAQAAKAVVTAAAMRVVDRALVLSGGAGYRAGTPLARAVGDVRALMFMNPLSTPRATELLADAALGLPTTLH